MLGFVIPLLLLIVLVGGVLGAFAGNFAILGVAVFFDIILIMLSVRIVQPNTVRAVEFFGKFNRILRPGLNFIIPVVEVTRSQVIYRRNFEVQVEGVTSDNVTAQIGLNVIYFVEDDKNGTESGTIYKSIYAIDDPKTMMKATIDEQLRGMMIAFTHKDIFSKREEIGDYIEQRLREKLSTFGYKLDSIQVRDVNLERSVMVAMNRVVESEKLKEAAFNEAEAKKIMQIKQAEAESEAKILLGKGMAGQRMEIAKGFSEAVEKIKEADDSLDGAKVLQFLLDSSRIETLSNIGSSEKTKLIYLNENLEGNGIGGRESKLIAGSDIMMQQK